MNYLDLFSGIGGFALGAYWAGWRFDEHYFSEVDDYAIRVYQQRFPEAVNLGDITKINTKKMSKAEWFITGGYPCQPFSTASRGRIRDKSMWPEIYRIINGLDSRMVIAENVQEDTILQARDDLREKEFLSETYCIPAAALGASHYRNRYWMVAYSYKNGQSHGTINAETSGISNLSRLVSEIDPRTMGSYDGLPNRLDRLKCLGNSIVPQIAEILFRRIKEIEYGRPT